MKPIYQTIFDNTKGNCYAATMASLLEKQLQEVPNFVEVEDHHQAVCDFLKPFGYEYMQYLINGNIRNEDKSSYEFFTNKLPIYGSINGYYDAVVYSPRYFNLDEHKSNPNYESTCHAVIIDRDFNIVHDPNPNYKDIKKYPLADELGYNGVIGVVLWDKIK